MRWFWLRWVFIAAWVSLSLRRAGATLVSVCGLLIAVAPLAVEPGLQGTHSSAVVVHRHSCSTACGIFLGQGQNLRLLPWQTDSVPLSHQGSPKILSSKWCLTADSKHYKDVGHLVFCSLLSP